MKGILPSGRFDMKNVARNLANDSNKHECNHHWVKKRMLVKRNGNGDATKMTHMKCTLCGEETEEYKTYNDTRIRYDE